MNPWPIYSAVKMNYFDTGRIMTVQDVISRFPNSSDEEIEEGMIEFMLAYHSDFKHYGPRPKDSFPEWLKDTIAAARGRSA